MIVRLALLMLLILVPTSFMTSAESPNDPQAVAHRAFADFKDGLATGVWEPWLAHLADDFRFRFPMGAWQGEHQGKAKAAEFFRFVSTAFPEGLKIEQVERVTASGSTVIFEFRDVGKLRGQPYDNWVAVSLDVCADKICAYREYFGKVGAPPPPPVPAPTSAKTLAPGIEGRPAISGVFEVGIGVPDLESACAYWERFGYRRGPEGRLDAPAARALYGVDSALKAVRLLHQDVDHGLIRLIAWDKSSGNGLDLAPMKALGSRWSAMLTTALLDLINHSEDAIAAHERLIFVPPQRQQIYAQASGRPFLDPAPGVREMLLVQPLSRQVLFQRFAYTLPHYGKINQEAMFPTSQITHSGLVIQGERTLLDFYDQTLGLKRARDRVDFPEKMDEAARAIFALKDGESYTTTDFDDPRSLPENPQTTRSGRLKIIRLSANVDAPDLRLNALPGALGLTFYSLRTADAEVLRQRVLKADASEVTAIQHNEIGEKSFSFIAPDGYAWVIVEAQD